MNGLTRYITTILTLLGTPNHLLVLRIILCCKFKFSWQKDLVFYALGFFMSKENYAVYEQKYTYRCKLQ